MRIMKIWKKI